MSRNKMFLIYEGISGSGKSTLLTEMMHKRNFVDFGLHRGPATEWVYGSMMGRKFSLQQNTAFEMTLNSIMPTCTILCSCPPELALSRKQALNDPHIEANLHLAADLFGIYFNHMCHTQFKILVDTTLDIEENVDIMNTYLKECERDYYNTRG